MLMTGNSPYAIKRQGQPAMRSTDHILYVKSMSHVLLNITRPHDKSPINVLNQIFYAIQWLFHFSDPHYPYPIRIVPHGGLTGAVDGWPDPFRQHQSSLFLTAVDDMTGGLIFMSRKALFNFITMCKPSFSLQRCSDEQLHLIKYAALAQLQSNFPRGSDPLKVKQINCLLMSIF